MGTPSAALVGTGFIGPVHAEALRRLGVPLAGVLGSSPEKSREASVRLNARCAYEDFDEVLADPAVQVVHLTSPNHLHFEQCARALNAGKHVICEKPLAIHPSESAELVRLAASQQLVAAVCYNIRFYPLNVEVRQRLQTLGPIHHVTGSYVQDWLLYDTDFNWRVLAPHAGPLRAIADIGTHWLDLIQFVTGLQVEALCADLATVIPTRFRPNDSVKTFSNDPPESERRTPVLIDTEDYGSMLLRFSNGVRGSMSISQVTAGRKNCLRYEIAAANGSLAWNSERSDELWIGHRNRPNELLIRDPALLDPAARSITRHPGGHNEGFAETFCQLFHAIYSWIARPSPDEPPFPTFADGHREVLICDAVQRSHRDQCWVRIDS